MKQPSDKQIKRLMGFEPTTFCMASRIRSILVSSPEAVVRATKRVSPFLSCSLGKNLARGLTRVCSHGVRKFGTGMAAVAVVAVFAVDVQSPVGSEDCRHPEYPKMNLVHRGWVDGLYQNPWLPKKAVVKHRRLMECAPSAAQRKAMRKRWQAAKKNVPVDNWQLWVAVGRCEQPGPGRWGVNWSFGPATYEGGLGFYASSWDAFKPKNAPDSAAYASWRQQMAAANNLWASVGWGWGCRP